MHRVFFWVDTIHGKTVWPQGLSLLGPAASAFEPKSFSQRRQVSFDGAYIHIFTFVVLNHLLDVWLRLVRS